MSETQHVFLASTNDYHRFMWFPIEEFTCQSSHFIWFVFIVLPHCVSELFVSRKFSKHPRPVKGGLSSPLIWLVGKLGKSLFCRHIFFFFFSQFRTVLCFSSTQVPEGWRPPVNRRIHCSPSVNSLVFNQKTEILGPLLLKRFSSYKRVLLIQGFPVPFPASTSSSSQLSVTQAPGDQMSSSVFSRYQHRYIPAPPPNYYLTK